MRTHTRFALLVPLLYMNACAIDDAGPPGAVAADERAAAGAAAEPAALVAAPSTTVYRGGPIVSQAHVRVILLGDFFTGSAVDPWRASLTDLLNRPQFYAPLAQYVGSNGAPQPGRLDVIHVEPVHLPMIGVPGTSCNGPWNPCATGQIITDAINKYDAIDAVDDNSIFMVVVEPGALLGLANDPGSITGGVHSAYAHNGHLVRWAVSAYDGANGLIDFSHELSETITDPYPDTPGQLPAYYNPEVGDLCEGKNAQVDYVTVQMEWSERDQKCVGYAAWPEFTTRDNHDGGTTLADSDGNADSSFVVAANEYSQSQPAVGQAVLVGINWQHDITYKAYDGTGDWHIWTEPANHGWVSRIAAVSSPARAWFDVIGIGGDGAVYWRPTVNALDDSFAYWSRIGNFTATDVAAARGDGAVLLYALGTDGVIRYQIVGGTAAPTADGWSTIGGLPGPATRFAVVGVRGLVDVAASVNGAWPPYLSRGGIARVGTFAHYVQNSFTNVGATSKPPFFLVPSRISSFGLGATGANSAGGARLAMFVTSDFGVWRTVDDGTDASLVANWIPTTLPIDATELAATNLSDGRIALFALDSHGAAWSQTQNSLTDGDWGAPVSRGGSIATLQAFTWPNGLMEIYGLDKATHQVAHDYQTSATTWQY